MEKVQSKDGTEIAYDTTGTGPALILVTGALGVYSSGGHTGFHELAAALAPHFTVINYDRRGRGESGDTQPFAVQREIEDIEALIDQVAGGKAFLYGISSGGALALETASALGSDKVEKLVIYEVPYVLDGSRSPLPEGYVENVRTYSATGRRSDAVALFMSVVGVPAEYIPAMQADPSWAGMEAVAHTLAYDGMAVEANMKGSGLTDDAKARWQAANMPALMMAGGDSEEFFRTTAQTLAALLPNARYEVLPGQNHNVDSGALYPPIQKFLQE